MMQTLKQRLFARITVDPLTPGACWIWTGSTVGNGYAQIRVNGRKIVAHRIVFELYNGPIPSDRQLDHRCHVRRCMNPEHLRIVTNKQNSEHLSGARASNRSGIRGVSWDASRSKWAVQAGHNGRNNHAGRFDDLATAATAAKGLRARLFTHDDADQWITPPDPDDCTVDDAEQGADEAEDRYIEWLGGRDD